MALIRKVPVVTGTQAVQENCTACRTGTQPRDRRVYADMDMTLCLDPVACGTRFRKGSTHAQYAEALRMGVPQ